MRVLISGSTGLIGSALRRSLEASGFEVCKLVRARTTDDPYAVPWDPELGFVDKDAMEGFDYVVHLAGEPLAGRWTRQKKARIWESRVKGTLLLSETLASLRYPPRALLSASAVGCYGNRGSDTLTEDSRLGRGFLADLCKRWEAATEPAADRGIRTVITRFGVALSEKGGALAQMLPPFRLGLGGRLGSGTQYMSWVEIEDIADAIGFIMSNDSFRGPVNIVAPNPVTNEEFTKILADVLQKPTFMPVPAFVLRAIYGDMADEVLLSSQRVLPYRLKAAGFTFRFPEISTALRYLMSATLVPAH